MYVCMYASAVPHDGTMSASISLVGIVLRIAFFGKCLAKPGSAAMPCRMPWLPKTGLAAAAAAAAPMAPAAICEAMLNPVSVAAEMR